MAFQAASIMEEVEFGKPGQEGYLKVVPKVDAELRLRLGQLRYSTIEEMAEATEVIASAFSENSWKVREFIEKNSVGAYELGRLAIYLAQGEAGVKSYEDRLDKFTDKQIEKMMEEQRGA